MIWGVGYKNSNKTWLTPVGQYNLPAYINASMTLTLDLSYSLSTTPIYLSIYSQTVLHL